MLEENDLLQVKAGEVESLKEDISKLEKYILDCEKRNGELEKTVEEQQELINLQPAEIKVHQEKLAKFKAAAELL